MAIMLCFCVVLVHKIALSLSAGVITDGPSTQVVLLNEFPQFQCRTARSAPRWIINDMDLDPVQKQYEDERGIRKILRSQIGSIDYVSVLEVHAIEINNNTVLQCAVYSGDAESEAAVLIIQGLLAAPPALAVTVLNLTTVHLTWSPPYTLNVTGNTQPSILAYSIVIKNGSGETILEANSTVNGYYYTIEEDECQFDAYVACVAGVNGVGIGLYSQPIRLAFGFVRLSASNTSTLHSATFSCDCFCHDSLLVTWLINGSFHFRRSPQFDDRTEQCPNRSTDVLEVFTKSLNSFTIQCTAVYVCECNQGGCRTKVSSPTMHYSPTEVLESLPHSSTNTAEDHITTGNNVISVDEGSKAQLTGPGIDLTIGTAAGITVFFCTLLIFILSIVICREMRMRKNKLRQQESPSVSDTVPVANEVIYEQCGDPVAPTTGVTPAIYESIKQSHLLDTQPCVAYDSAHPTMEPCLDTQPCVAYDSAHPTMEPCVAYATQR